MTTTLYTNELTFQRHQKMVKAQRQGIIEEIDAIEFAIEQLRVELSEDQAELAREKVRLSLFEREHKKYLKE